MPSPTILNIRWGLGFQGDERPKELKMDLAIFLDDKKLADVEMTYGEGRKPQPADFEPFEIGGPGKHRLRVETVAGKAKFEMDIKLGSSNYLQIDYFYLGKGHPSGKLGVFSAFVQDKPHYYR